MSMLIHSNIRTDVSPPVVAHADVTSTAKLSSAEISYWAPTYSLRFDFIKEINIIGLINSFI